MRIAIPDDPSQRTFGQTLYVHLFIHGTRPDRDPDDDAGLPWTADEAAKAMGTSIRNLGHWLADKHRPVTIVPIEKALFGEDTKRFRKERAELRRLWDKAKKTRNETKNEDKSPDLPTTTTGTAITIYTTPFEDDEVDGPLTPEDFRALAPQSSENFGKTGEKSRESRATGLGSVFGGKSKGPRDQDRAARAQSPQGWPPRRKSKIATAMIAGLVLLFGGYAAKRYADWQKEISAATTEAGKKHTPGNGKGDTGAERPEGTTAEQQRAADAKRKEDERLAKLKQTTIDAANAKRAKDEAKAKEDNIKLTGMEQSKANDLCAIKLKGLEQPGFTLKCDTQIPFGVLLKRVGVSQTASSLNDCAARCRKEDDCVAFSFDAGAHEGARSCYLTGSIPEQKAATNWIAGLRRIP